MWSYVQDNWLKSEKLMSLEIWPQVVIVLVMVIETVNDISLRHPLGVDTNIKMISRAGLLI